MKITVFEARAFAVTKLREACPDNARNIQMVFSLDDAENDRMILALYKGFSSGLGLLKLVQLGLADNYDDAKRIVEKAQKKA